MIAFNFHSDEFDSATTSSIEYVTVKLRLTNERHFQSMGNEVWILDICDASGHSIIDWESSKPTPPWQIADADKKAGTKALIASEPTEINFNLPAGSMLRVLKHAWSGIIEITYEKTVQKVDLFSPDYDSFTFQVSQGESYARRQSNSLAGAHPQPDLIHPLFSDDERKLLERIARYRPAAVAITHPEWRGVRKSAEEQFNYIFYLKDDIDEEKAYRIVAMLADYGCKRIVISGFPLSYRYLIETIHHQKLNIKVFVIWHASFLQSNEEFNWRGFKIIHDLCQKDLIAKWGFDKKGMAETLAKTGVETGFVMNYVRSVPDRASSPKNGGPYLGLWALAPIWRKSPYAMMAAAATIPQAKLFAVGQNERAQEFGIFFKLNVTYQTEPIPQDELPDALARMHLNLYVTLSECGPMLPLQSLSAGVPCLIGPNSHLFEDNPYLHSRLVVPYPDRSDVIAQYIKKALEERNEIVEAYIRYAPDYNRRARRSLCDFLEISSDSVL